MRPAKRHLAALVVAASALCAGCEVLDVLGPLPGEPRAGPGMMGGTGAVITAWPMDCEICAGTIVTRALRIPGVAAASVDMEREAVVVTFAPGATVSRDALVAAVEDAGFHLRDVRAVY